MANNVQTVSVVTGQVDNAQLTKGIDHNCDAPISLMTFFDRAAVRIIAPQAAPIDDINRRFFLGESAKLRGWYRMSLAKFLTTRPPELAEAIFSFGLIEKGQPDIIRLRAIDHIGEPDKNLVLAFYLVWQIEAFPDPKNYHGHALGELVAELAELASSGVTQSVLNAIITRINNCERLNR